MNKHARKFYASPEAEMIEIDAQGAILASSPNTTDAYEREIW